MMARPTKDRPIPPAISAHTRPPAPAHGGFDYIPDWPYGRDTTTWPDGILIHDLRNEEEWYISAAEPDRKPGSIGSFDTLWLTLTKDEYEEAYADLVHRIARELTTPKPDMWNTFP